MGSNVFRSAKLGSLCLLVFAVSSCGEIAYPLRKFFKNNNKLVLVNPFPHALPMGDIVRPERGELREINRRCFVDHQDELVPPHPYDFIAVNTAKKFTITAPIVARLGDIGIASSQRVSIAVLEGKRSLLDESAFRTIIDDPNFPTECSEDISDPRNYIVYEIITGRLSFTFWQKARGKWEVNPIASALTSTEGEEVASPLLWTVTQKGQIEMKEPRVLAVHARKWKRGSRGEFRKPMPSFQFNNIWRLNWRLLGPTQ